jgi:hypothetical protein
LGGLVKLSLPRPACTHVHVTRVLAH